MTYARARKLDPMTGDWTWDAVSQGHATSPSPAMEAVVLTLRTTLGSCLAAPEFGADWDRLQKLRGTAEAEAVLLAALRPLETAGVIRESQARAEEGDQGRLLYEVSFVDVRASQRRVVRGRTP